MPGSDYQLISRKQFLNASITAMGALAWEGAAWAIAPAEDTYQIALLSDTHVPAEYLGHIDPRPTVLVVHHTLGDGDGDLLDVDRLYRIVEPHRQVKAIFYGHSHHYGVSRRGNLHLINLPAVGYNFNDGEPVGWLNANFTKTGVSLTLHTIGGNQADNGKTRVIQWS